MRKVKDMNESISEIEKENGSFYMINIDEEIVCTLLSYYYLL